MKILIALVAALFLSAFNATAQSLKTIEALQAEAIADLDYVDNAYLIQRLRANPDLLLLDVRTASEFDAGHIPGAVWMERGIVEFRLARILRDPEKEIIVYCKKGYRSGLVVKALHASGYTNVNVHVGFDDWAAAGNSIEDFLGVSHMVEFRAFNAATQANPR